MASTSNPDLDDTEDFNLSKRQAVKKFCEEAGFQGNYTNHSGKVTCATTLFQSGVDEQLIMKQTGHCSHELEMF